MLTGLINVRINDINIQRGQNRVNN